MSPPLTSGVWARASEPRAHCGAQPAPADSLKGTLGTCTPLAKQHQQRQCLWAIVACEKQQQQQGH